MKKLSRWAYVVVGVAVLLFSGMVYAWSVLSGPIAAEFPQWSQSQLSLTFTIVMALFCLGGMTGGFLSGKVSQKIYLWVSAALFLVGFFMASRIQSLAGLYISFGVICGFASGLSYNGVLSTVGKWFPDKQGLISGILLMGFGLSSFLVGKIYQAATPDTIGAWRTSFLVLGIVTAVVMALCGFLLEKPGPDFAAPAAAGKKRAVCPVAAELSAGQLLAVLSVGHSGQRRRPCAGKSGQRHCPRGGTGGHRLHHCHCGGDDLHFQRHRPCDFRRHV